MKRKIYRIKKEQLKRFKSKCDIYSRLDSMEERLWMATWQSTLVVLMLCALIFLCVTFRLISADDKVNANVGNMEPVETTVVEEPIETVEETLIFTEPETVAEETVIEETAITEIEEVEPVVPAVRYFDVPLSEDLQDHIFAVCENRGVDPLLVMAIIQKESTYGKFLYGDNGNSLGLMQIQPRWHSARMERLGCTDLLDPFQNVTVGIDILAELFSMSENLDWVLMAYNGGYGHANGHIAAGTISDYAATVKHYMNNIERK